MKKPASFHTATTIIAPSTVCLSPSQLWLGDKHTVLGAMIVVAVWKEAGFFMIFYLAALQQIAPSLAEAAALEGASRWQYFRRVLFPLLMPTTLFVLINALINSVRMVDHIFVMTRGGSTASARPLRARPL